MFLVCRTLRIDLPDPSQLQLLDPLNANAAALTKELKFELRGKAKATPRAVQLALQADLTHVVTAARARHPMIERAKGRAIVVLDAIDKYDKKLLSDLFNDKILGAHGLGPITPAGSGDLEPVPVALSFALAGPAQEILKPIVEAPVVRSWLTLLQVGPFKEDGEDMLAYERVLLHPFNPGLLQGFSDRRFTISDQADEALVKEWEANFRMMLQGRPKALTERMLYATAKMALDAGFLKIADDDDVLRRLGVKS
jgi:hypothetical protein